MSQDRVQRIHRLLTAALHPTTLHIEDQSHLHVGHAGARESGGGHFTVYINCPAFTGCSPVERHRLVYDALREMMPGEIHALSVKVVAD